MSLHAFLICAVALAAPALAMDCSFGRSDNPLEKVINTCPRPIIDPNEKSFCCMDTNGDFYCCEAPSFALFIFLALLIIIVPLMLICCIIGCVWRCICGSSSHQRVRVVY